MPKNTKTFGFFLVLLIKAYIMSFTISVKGDTQCYEEETFYWVRKNCHFSLMCFLNIYNCVCNSNLEIHL